MEVQLKIREADRKKVKSFLTFPVFETVKLPFGHARINCHRDRGEAEVNHKHSESEISNCYVKKSKFLCTIPKSFFPLWFLSKIQNIAVTSEQEYNYTKYLHYKETC